VYYLGFSVLYDLITAYPQNISVFNCVNEGNIKDITANSDYTYASGIVGVFDYKVHNVLLKDNYLPLLNNCINTGNITGTGKNSNLTIDYMATSNKNIILANCGISENSTGQLNINNERTIKKYNSANNEWVDTDNINVYSDTNMPVVNCHTLPILRFKSTKKLTESFNSPLAGKATDIKYTWNNTSSSINISSINNGINPTISCVSDDTSTAVLSVSGLSNAYYDNDSGNYVNNSSEAHKNIDTVYINATGFELPERDNINVVVGNNNNGNYDDEGTTVKEHKIGSDSNGYNYIAKGNYIYKEDKAGNIISITDERHNFGFDFAGNIRERETLAIDSDGNSYTSFGIYLYKVDKTGNIVWTRKEENNITNVKSYLISSEKDIIYYTTYEPSTTSIVADTIISETSTNNTILKSINTNGELKWSLNLDSIVCMTIDENGYIYVGSYYGYIQKIDPDTGNIVSITNNNEITNKYYPLNISTADCTITNLMYDKDNKLFYVVLSGTIVDSDGTPISFVDNYDGLSKYKKSHSIIKCLTGDFTSNKKTEILQKLDYTNTNKEFNFTLSISMDNFAYITVDRVGREGTIKFKPDKSNTTSVTKNNITTTTIPLLSNELSQKAFVSGYGSIVVVSDISNKTTTTVNLQFNDIPMRDIELTSYIISDFNELWTYVFRYDYHNDVNVFNISAIDFNNTNELFFTVNNNNLYKLNTTNFKSGTFIDEDYYYYYTTDLTTSAIKIVENQTEYNITDLIKSKDNFVKVNLVYINSSNVFIYGDNNDYNLSSDGLTIILTNKGLSKLEAYIKNNASTTAFYANYTQKVNIDDISKYTTYSVNEDYNYASILLKTIRYNTLVETYNFKKELTGVSTNSSNEKIIKKGKYLDYIKTWSSETEIIYQYNENSKDADKGDKKSTNYILHSDSLRLRVYKDNAFLTENVDYIFEKSNVSNTSKQVLVFTEPVRYNNTIKIEFYLTPFANTWLYSETSYNNLVSKKTKVQLNTVDAPTYVMLAKVYVNGKMLDEGTDYTVDNNEKIIIFTSNITGEDIIKIITYKKLYQIYSISIDNYSGDKYMAVGCNHSLLIMNKFGDETYSTTAENKTTSIVNKINDDNFVYFVHNKDILTKLYFIITGGKYLTSPDYYSNGIIVVKVNKMISEIFEVLKMVRPAGWKLIVEGNYGVFYDFNDKIDYNVDSSNVITDKKDSNGHYYYMDHTSDDVIENGKDYRYKYIEKYYDNELNPMEQLEEKDTDYNKQFVNSVQYTSTGYMIISMLGKTFIFNTDKPINKEDLENSFYEGVDTLTYNGTKLNTDDWKKWNDIRATYTMFRDPIQYWSYNGSEGSYNTDDANMDIEVVIPKEIIDEDGNVIQSVDSMLITIVGGGGGSAIPVSVGTYSNISVGGGGAEFAENILIDLTTTENKNRSTTEARTLILHAGDGGVPGQMGKTSYVKWKYNADGTELNSDSYIIQAYGGYSPSEIDITSEKWAGGSGRKASSPTYKFISGSDGASIYSKLITWKEINNSSIEKLIPVWDSYDNEVNKGNGIVYNNYITTTTDNNQEIHYNFYTAGGSSYHRGKGIENNYDLHYGAGGCYGISNKNKGEYVQGAGGNGYIEVKYYPIN
jgi:hypothetical protein